jgi:hypothetical protein
MSKKSVKRQITIRYLLSPNFPPEGNNLVTWDCDKLSYFWPAHPSMNISSFVSPTPVGFTGIRHDTGECKQFLAYQLIDVTYNYGFEKTVEEETEKTRAAMAREAERLAAMGEGGENKTAPETPMSPCCTTPPDVGFQ